MKVCANKQERLIGVLVELKSVNGSESCLLRPRELEISPYKLKTTNGKLNLR